MSRYARLALKMSGIDDNELGENESPFSTNLVTGESINFPIVETCKPSKVCAKTCYAACGPITWSASLKKQIRVYHSCLNNPFDFATKVIKHRKADFITWNGSGDLFDESIKAIDFVAMGLPQVPIWIRTRIPEMAVRVRNRPNVFVHFSLDRHSMNRHKEAGLLGGIKAKHHFSYQYDKDEDGHYPGEASIVFGHDYKMPKGIDGNEVCVLNRLEKIGGACGKCRKCFGGM